MIVRSSRRYRTDTSAQGLDNRRYTLFRGAGQRERRSPAASGGGSVLSGYWETGFSSSEVRSGGAVSTLGSAFRTYR